MRAEAVVIDTGEFNTVAVNGCVYLQATSPLTIRRRNRACLYLRHGSMLHLNRLTGSRGRIRRLPGEGTGFILDTLENTSVAGTVHYADASLLWE